MKEITEGIHTCFEFLIWGINSNERAKQFIWFRRAKEEEVNRRNLNGTFSVMVVCNTVCLTCDLRQLQSRIKVSFVFLLCVIKSALKKALIKSTGQRFESEIS